MPRTYNEAYVKCPFFISCGYTSITCEGITSECKLKLLFDEAEKRDKQRKIFCDDHYMNCEIYQVLVKKYEDEE